MLSFNELDLPARLQSALSEINFTKPTPIQAQAIPVILQRHDLIGCANTGTGKTAAFSIPLVARLLENPTKQAVILVPTRELASQIMDVLLKLTGKDLRVALLIGGVPMPPQYRALSKHPRILVATPGRLMDHLRRGSVGLNEVEMLVLDEADRMLDMGFAPQLNEILRYLPKDRQTLLFSATVPNDILKLAAKFLRNPVRVTVTAPKEDLSKNLNQAVIHTNSMDKRNVLANELKTREGTVLIFTQTQMRTDRVARFLSGTGHQVSQIHGGLSQRQRRQALDGFRAGTFRILVATDIAARGLDVPHIAHVINYDLPQQPEDFIHRIGRTARAGAKGNALSFLTPEDRGQWQIISKIMRAT